MFQAEIILKGIVQGVGFRPFVKRTAVEHNIYGKVVNREFGVKITAVGTQNNLKMFYNSLLTNKPIISEIIDHKIRIVPETTFKEKRFFIARSKKDGEISTFFPPDIATCEKCLQDINNPNDRHYLYPFTNCTNCGPRFSIIKSLPYDRENTTMQKFKMCSNCAEEYNTIKDRRYHAQPNACNQCGPQIKLIEIKSWERQVIAKKNNAIKKTVELIKSGKIVAIKGLGGYHLTCDALNKDAVNMLRKLKNRPQKPFALMANSIDTIEKYCNISKYEKGALTGEQKPIVLLLKKRMINLFNIAPDINRLGFMLPYTPLHYLIMQNFSVLVMTSGNISGEALEKDDESAIKNLCKYSHHFLNYDREIQNRIDDSIVKYAGKTRILIRKARGFIPLPIKISSPLTKKQIFAAGGDMKGSFGLLKNNIFLGSQYLGDLQYLSNNEFYQESLDYFKSLFDVKPEIAVVDKHPNYFSTKYALKYQQTHKIPLYYIQHHIAHIYSVMAENNLKETIGVSLDGTGYGNDEQIWGGEFFHINEDKCTRMAHLKYVPMISGDMVAKEPWRMGVIYLFNACPEKISTFYPEKKYPAIKYLIQLLKKKEYNLYTSSMGRLFDAIASILSICHYNTYEGEAPMKLEAIAVEKNYGKYNWELNKNNSCWQIDVSKVINDIIRDLENNTSKKVIATKFHFTSVDIIYDLCKKIKAIKAINNISFSGGVLQNALLVNLIKDRFRGSEFSIYFNEKVPPNDAGIALGQIYGNLLKN